MNREDKIDLISKYLDSAMTEAEVAHFSSVLASDPEMAVLLRDLAMQDVLLGRVPARVSRKFGWMSFRRVMALAASLLLLSGAGTFLVFHQTGPSDSGTIRQVSGAVHIMLPDGAVEEVVAPRSCPAGSVLKVDGDSGSARLVLGESGTEDSVVALEHGTELELNRQTSQQKGRSVHLRMGKVEVTHNRKGTPFAVETDFGVARVVGTKFSVELKTEKEEEMGKIKKVVKMVMVTAVTAGTVVISNQYGVVEAGADDVVVTTTTAAPVKSGNAPDDLTKQAGDALDKITIPELEFRQANLRDVVDMLGQSSLEFDPEQRGVNLVLIGEKYATVTLKARNVSLKQALKVICEMCDAKYSVDESVVTISPRKPEKANQAVVGLIPAKSDSAPDALTKRTLDALDKITIPEQEYRQSTLHSVVDELQKVSIEFDPEKRGVNLVVIGDKYATVTFKARNVSLKQVLKIICEMCDAKYRVDGNTVTISPLAGGASVSLPASSKPSTAAQPPYTSEV